MNMVASGPQNALACMQGGYGYVSDIDVRDSRQLLEKVLKPQIEEAAAGRRTLVALDCGAGVGRVAKELLLHIFQEVDLLEPSQHLLEAAEKDLKRNSKKLQSPPNHRAVNFYLNGLQNHVFEHQRYDTIWIQWCLLYLTDDDVVLLFNRCRSGLKPDGLIFVKENICRQGFIVDKEDSSLTRSNAYMQELFEKANMQLLYNVKQRQFPKELFEVRMYALRPR
ncbi:alpha-N-methyltransferase NTM1 [Dunaliella salina]|uniref:Alpha N-terminal protein methyltransferase 1 n=1 Tax=Dunaliella salina TaxID=3046 RepID=A0ABQ7GWG8_DUNSA|nr:alpha-N-methyltransferase NTM1 [Dunaliella salina]|eukprot:KAF5838956.1 alpha-N-methyltransferase NTM1 [Dunaliella salina]